MRVPSVLLPIAAACCLVGSLSACGAGGAGGAAPAATSSPGASVSASPSGTASTAAASPIDGRWIVAGEPATTIAFTDGAWTASSSCTTGAVGGRGVYRDLGGGRLSVTRTATPVRGCPVTDGSQQRRAGAITAIARAASFRVEGDRLTLFDASGAELGSLVRP